MNLALWLQRTARTSPQLPAVGFGADDLLGYGRLADRVASLAATLRTVHELKRGDRVALVAKNHPSYVEALFAAWWGGFTAVPVNPKLHRSEIEWILGHCDVAAVLVSPDLAPDVGAIVHDGIAVLEFDSQGWKSATGEQVSVGPAAVAPEELAWLFYTSGTTGRPKGAMLTHGNLAAMTFGYLADVESPRPGDALLHGAPMSHGSGLYLMAQVCRGALNVVPESGGFDAEEVLSITQVRDGCSMFAAPTMVNRLSRAATEQRRPPFRTLIWGGAPMPEDDVRSALERLGPCLAQIYGQGESPMTTTVLAKSVVADDTHERWQHRLASAGVANSAVDVRVATPAGEAGVDEPGEVRVRGATVMRGYWQDDSATAAALDDGWLRTGDIGAFDQDGFLTLRDRSKDMIISGGSNVYPREVEDVLLAHPDVIEASVIGRPDAEWGEVIVAYVVGAADPGELDRMCLDSIARFKRPKEYIVLDELPRNSTGKVLKTRLRELDRTRRDSE